jgi:titin
MSITNPIDASSNCEVFTWYTTGPNPNTNPPNQYPVPNPPRLWSRFISPCPGINADYNALNMRRKAEILKYKNNSSNLTKSQEYSMASRNALTRKKSWATQSETYTNPNIDNLPVSNNSIVCPSPLIQCALTSDSDVPGPITKLCYDPLVPLYNYKNDHSYSQGGASYVADITLISPNFEAPLVTESTITLFWTSPRDYAGYEITGYKIFINPPAPGIGNYIIINDPSIKTTTINGLTTLLTYTLSITGIANYQEFYSSTIFVTPQPAPEAPKNVKALLSNNLSVFVTWDTPNSVFPVKGYNVFVYLEGTTNFLKKLNLNTPTNSYLVSGLEDSKTYYFKVTAFSDMGLSNLSQPSSNLIVYDVPSLPLNLNVNFKYNFGIIVAAISWEKPANTNNNTYTITYTPNIGNPLSTSNITTTTTSIEISNLSSQTLYVFSIVSSNPAGSSQRAVINTNTPSSFTSVDSLNAIVGNKQVTLNWNKPLNAPLSQYMQISSYTISYNIVGQLQQTQVIKPKTVNSNSETITITNLNNGTNYNFKVYANIEFYGTSEIATTIQMPVSIPEVPSNITNVPSFKQVILNWNAPFNNGSIITKYNIVYDPSGGNPNTPFDVSANTASISQTATITNLINGTSYNFKISAINSIGSSVYSSIVTSRPFGAPEIPINIVATPGIRQFTLIWDEPVNNGGYDITTFNIKYGTSPTTLIMWAPPVGTEKNKTQLINGLLDNTTYYFQISASNLYYTSNYSTLSTVTTFNFPSQVTGLTGNLQLNNNLILTWNIPSNNGGSPITSYVIKYGIVGTSLIQYPTLATTNNITITGLNNNKTYSFQVAAISSVGTGVYSDFYYIGTYDVPSIVQNVSLLVTDAGKVNVSWLPPQSNGNSAITGYTIMYGIVGGGTFLTYNNPVGTDLSLNQTVTGLSNATQYNFKIAAKNNVGNGPFSDLYTIQTADVPSKIDINSISGNFGTIGNGGGNGNTQVILNWATPINGGIPIIGYKIMFLPSTPNTVIYDTSNALTTYVKNGLNNNTTYTFKIAAYNNVGTGSFSDVFSITTPNVPSAILLSQISSVVIAKQVTLNWSSPSSDGGTPITSYNIIYTPTDPSGATPTSPITLINGGTQIIKNLNNNTTYNFQIAAVNSVGIGNYSSVYSILTPDVPSQVKNLSGVVAASQVTLSWLTPDNNGGASITSYIIRYSAIGGTLLTWVPTVGSSSLSLTQTITGLLNGKEYIFNVVAVNGAGESPISSIKLVPCGVPDAPNVTNITGADKSVTIVWYAPNDNGFTITSYNITYSPSTGGIPSSPINNISPISTQMSQTIIGLTNGIPYTFYITAINSAGSSSITTVTGTPLGGPSAPLNISAIAGPLSGQVTLSWQPPSTTGGGTIQSYKITYTPTTGNPTSIPASPLIVQSNTSSQIFTQLFTQLSIGVTYTFNICAVTTTGINGLIGSNSVKTFSVPSQINNFTGIRGIRQLSLNWQPPYSTGSSSLTSYSISYTPTTGTPSTPYDVSANITSQIFSSLLNGTTYNFSIIAKNTVGNGNNPATLSIATYDKPSKVLNVTGTKAIRQVTLNWTTPTNDGGLPIKTYYIYYGAGNNIYQTIDISGVNTSKLINNNLSNGTTYNFQVGAVNDVIDLNNLPNYSDIYTLTTPDVPGKVDINTITGTITYTSITLQWTAPLTDPNYPIIYYRISYSPLTINPTVITTTDTTTTYVINTLLSGTTYFFRILAVNAVGDGLYSSEYRITTLMPSVPSPITDLNVTNNGNNQISLTWTKPAENGSNISKYVISYYPLGSVILYSPFNVVNNNTQVVYNVPGLGSGKTYNFQVAPINSMGTGQFTNVSNITTLSGPPQAVKALTFYIDSNQNQVISWQYPDDDGGSEIKSFKVYYGTDINNLPFYPYEQNLLITSRIVNNIQINQNSTYFKVTAVNQIGEGVASTIIISKPSPPTLINANPDPINAGNVILYWTPPLHQGFLTITSYTIQYRTSTSVYGPAGNWQTFSSSIANNLTTYTVTGLTSNVFYDFQIAASNIVGMGIYSNIMSEVPYPYVPEVIILNNANYFPTNASATGDVGLVIGFPAGNWPVGYSNFTGVTINAPVNGNNITINSPSYGTKYYVYYQNDAAGFYSSLSNAGFQNVASVIQSAITGGIVFGNNGLTFTFTGGSGTAPSTYTCNYISPSWLDITQGHMAVFYSSITNSTIPGFSSNGFYQLGWQGFPGVANNINTAWSTPVYNNIISNQVFNLPVNTNTYYYYYAGIPKILIPNNTPTLPQSSPNSLTQHLLNGQIQISWTAPLSDGGSEIIGYKIYYQVSTGGPINSIYINGIYNTNYTFTNLVNNINYNVYVTSINAIGEGPQTASIITSAVSQGVTNLNSSIAYQSITATWSEPTSNGGQPITSYKISYSSDNTNYTYYTPPTGTQLNKTVTLNGLNNPTYYIKVVPVNAVGDGAASTITVNFPTPQAIPNFKYTIGDGSSGSLTWDTPLLNNNPGLIGTITSYTMVIYKYNTFSNSHVSLHVNTTLTSNSFDVTSIENFDSFKVKLYATSSYGINSPLFVNYYLKTVNNLVYYNDWYVDGQVYGDIYGDGGAVYKFFRNLAQANLLYTNADNGGTRIYGSKLLGGNAGEAYYSYSINRTTNPYAYSGSLYGYSWSWTQDNSLSQWTDGYASTLLNQSIGILANY